MHTTCLSRYFNYISYSQLKNEGYDVDNIRVPVVKYNLDNIEYDNKHGYHDITTKKEWIIINMIYIIELNSKNANLYIKKFGKINLFNQFHNLFIV